MALILDGTTGITSDGGTPVIENLNTTATGIDVTGEVTSDGLTVDSTTLVVDEVNNRVGIGTTSPLRKFHVSSSEIVAGILESTNTYSMLRFLDSVNTVQASAAGIGSTGTELALYSNGAERARIDSSGALLVGTTSNSGEGWTFEAVGYGVSRKAGTADSVHWSFKRGSNTEVGKIQSNGSSTSYVTSSDYRLKENVVGVTGASARVQQLNPVRFNFIADPDKTVDGFLAHEVQDVVPEAITGTKDAVDAEGNPVYQGIDQSKLVPLLTAALQEALGKIETLEARVAALEAA